MKPFPHQSQNQADLSASDLHKKKVTHRDPQADVVPEETEKSSASQSKSGQHFDFTNFGIFFKHKSKSSNSRSSKDSNNSRFHLKKKSNETSSSKESTLKRMSSKDFSNIEELYENTTVITNPSESKFHSKQVSEDVSASNLLIEEELSSEDQTDDRRKRTAPAYGNSRGKEERQGAAQKFLYQSGDHNEELKKIETLFSKDMSGLNAEVIERIKNKAFPNRRRPSISNLNTNSMSNLSQNSETPSAVRTNNNSIFNAWRHTYQEPDSESYENTENSFNDPIRASVSALFSPLEGENFVPVSKLEKQSLGAVVSQEKEKTVPTSLLTKSIEAQEGGLEKMAKKKSNSPTIATDSTLDSDYLTTFNFNNHSNSFPTPSSVASSFNNSGKIDLNSPFRLDSGRPTENVHASPNVQSTVSGPNQKSFFNLGQNLTGYFGGSGNNTDRSSSLSWNEDYAMSNFSSALSTPQGLQQSSFFGRDFIPPSSFNNKEQSYGNPLPHVPQTTRSVSNNTYVASDQTSNQSFSSSSTSVALEKASSNKKESKPNAQKNKKKGQDPRDSSQFEVDVSKAEYDSRTTLMVKNIPNKYDLPLLLQTVEKNHKGKFDFFYLPIDPRNKCNVGYAFINFTDTRFIKNFFFEFNGKKWEKFNSEKVCDIKYARIQGKKALINHFQYSNVMNQQDKKLRPYVPAEYEVFNQKIKELVTKQWLESSEDY